jgi:hypothetical protein
MGGGAIALHANDSDAIDFMNGRFLFRSQWAIFSVLIAISWIVPGLSTLLFKKRRNREFERAQQNK